MACANLLIKQRMYKISQVVNACLPLGVKIDYGQEMNTDILPGEDSKPVLFLMPINGILRHPPSRICAVSRPVESH